VKRVRRNAADAMEEIRVKKRIEKIVAVAPSEKTAAHSDSVQPLESATAGSPSNSSPVGDSAADADGWVEEQEF
jgi:HEAT repeat protein